MDGAKVASRRPAATPDQTMQDIVCPVCGDPATDRLVVCVRCRTPHHPDCADFVGTCATFGCGGRQFESIRAELARTDEQVVLSHEPERGRAEDVRPPIRRRGLVSRAVAAGALLLTNPGLTLGLFLGMVCVEQFVSQLKVLPVFRWSTLGYFLSAAIPIAVVDGFAKGALVISFIARARGKESGLHQVASLLKERGLRIASVTVAVSLVAWSPYLLYDLYGVPYRSMDLIQVIQWAALMFLVLSPIVAAVGSEEEPGNALLRSVVLVRRRLGHAIASQICFYGLSVLTSRLAATLARSYALSFTGGGFLLFRVAFDLVMLFSTAYWLLFYLEVRRLDPHTT